LANEIWAVLNRHLGSNSQVSFDIDQYRLNSFVLLFDDVVMINSIGRM
jgi:hypothetical protein